MKYGIIGAGNTGKAAAAYLAACGQSALMWDRSEERLAPIRQKGLTATGCVCGSYPVRVAADLAQLAAECDVLMLFTVAAGHLPIARQLAGKLRQGQVIVVTNGCWGAVELDSVLRAEADEKDVTIAETNGQLILCQSPAADAVYLKTIKQSMLLACTKPTRADKVCRLLRPEWPQFTQGANVLETSLSGTNPITHGPLTLFNLARMENSEEYLLFGDGMSGKTARYIEQIDAERVAVAKACGVQIGSALSLLNQAWPAAQSSIYDAFHNNPSYMISKGPGTLQHRYLTEDLPYGLAPLVRLGRKYGVQTPYLDALVTVLSLAMETDYLSLSPKVEQLELSRYL